MVLNKPVRRIAIVGTGVISASWAAEFLAHGFDVIATEGGRGPRAAVSIRKRTFPASAGRWSCSVSASRPQWRRMQWRCGRL
jgi:glycine/D-amino acid oxidase-like deaminating enzyme